MNVCIFMVIRRGKHRYFHLPTFFMYPWSGIGSPLSPSTVGVTEILFSTLGITTLTLHFGLNSIYIEHGTDRYMGLLERHPDKSLPHSETGSTFTNIMACRFNQITGNACFIIGKDET